MRRVRSGEREVRKCSGRKEGKSARVQRELASERERESDKGQRYEKVQRARKGESEGFRYS